MVWVFLIVANDADAGGKDRKREDYIPFYQLLRHRN